MAEDKFEKIKSLSALEPAGARKLSAREAADIEEEHCKFSKLLDEFRKDYREFDKAARELFVANRAGGPVEGTEFLTEYKQKKENVRQRAENLHHCIEEIIGELKSLSEASLSQSDKIWTSALNTIIILSITAFILAVFFSIWAKRITKSITEDNLKRERLVISSTVRALSMQRKGEIIHNYAYKLEGTPCSRVMQEGYCIFPEGVSRLFPGDEDLVELKVEGYVGIPLLDKFKKPLGLLNVISSRKLTLPPRTEQIMGITASKAAAEIERKQSEEALLKSKELFQKIFKTQRDAIFILNANKIVTILDCNPAAVEIFGYSKEEMVSRTAVFLHVNERTE